MEKAKATYGDDEWQLQARHSAHAIEVERELTYLLRMIYDDARVVIDN